MNKIATAKIQSRVWRAITEVPGLLGKANVAGVPVSMHCGQSEPANLMRGPWRRTPLLRTTTLYAPFPRSPNNPENPEGGRRMTQSPGV